MQFLVQASKANTQLETGAVQVIIAVQRSGTLSENDDSAYVAAVGRFASEKPSFDDMGPIAHELAVIVFRYYACQLCSCRRSSQEHEGPFLRGISLPTAHFDLWHGVSVSRRWLK